MRPSLMLTGALVVGVVAALVGCARGVDQTSEGIDLAIVFDTSASMAERVRDGSGARAPKHVIASRALGVVVDRLAAYAAVSRKPLNVGLIRFSGSRAGVAVPFGPFDPEAFKAWIRRGESPRGLTPLGRSVTLAGRWVLSSPCTHNHILVITDGMNTAGPDLKEVIPRVREAVTRKGGKVGFHMVAFDLDAAVFDDVRQEATVVSAADEVQLDDQLSFILGQKILLEAPEPPRLSSRKED